MSPDQDKERQEALAAVERLYRRGTLDLQEATQAARLISGDENLPFPPPPPEKPHETPAQKPAPQTENAGEVVPQ